MKLPDRLHALLGNNTHAKEITEKGLVSFVVKSAGLLSGFLFTYLLAKLYGAAYLGVFSLSLSLLQLFVVVSLFGCDAAILKYTSHFYSLASHGAAENVYKMILKIIIPVGLLLSLLFYFLSPFLADRIFDNPTAATNFRIASLVVLPFTLTWLHAEKFRGMKNIVAFSFFKDTAFFFFSLPALAIIFILYRHFLLPEIFFACGVLVSCALSFWMNAKLRHSPFVQSESSIKYADLLSFALPMLVVTFLNTLMGHLNTLMVGIFCTEKETGIFSTALKLANLTALPLVAVNSIVAPRIAEEYAKRDVPAIGSIVQQAAKIVFWISAPLLLMFFLFPGFCLGIFGEEFRAGKNALWMLAFGQFVNAACGSVGYTLQMTGKQQIFKNIILFSAALNTVLNYLLIPLIGIDGAAVAAMATTISWNVIAVVYIKKSLGILTLYLPFLKKKT